MKKENVGLVLSQLGVYFLCLLSVLSSCQKEKPKATPPNVSISIVQQRDVPVYVEAIGQVFPPVTVAVRSQVQGKLLQAFIRQGDIVEKGQILYKIDPRPYEAALEAAQAQLVHDVALLEIAQKTVERYKTVIEDDYISKLTYEQYQSNLKAAEAQVKLDEANIEAARLNVEFCTIVAPVAGKISYFEVFPGNILAAYDTQAITEIRPFNPIDVQFALSQQQFEKIRKVQGDEGIWPFSATLPENPTVSFTGKTYFIDNQVDQNTGTILLRGRFFNEKRELWPGQFIKVSVLQKMANDAFVVPPGGVLTGKNGPYLYILDDEDQAQPLDVTVVMKTNEYIAFESDKVKKGDRVIVDGQINVRPGMKVNPKGE